MNYQQLKKTRAWNQLNRQEKRFLKTYLEDTNPKIQTRVRIILERADKKAEVQSRIPLPPPELTITLGNASVLAKFTHDHCVEVLGDVPYEDQTEFVSIVLQLDPRGVWNRRSGEGPEQLQNHVTASFEQWAKEHPKFLEFTRRVLGDKP